MCVCVYIHIDIYVYTYMYICIYVYTYICILVYVNMYVFKYVYVYMYICIYVYMVGRCGWIHAMNPLLKSHCLGFSAPLHAGSLNVAAVAQPSCWFLLPLPARQVPTTQSCQTPALGQPPRILIGKGLTYSPGPRAPLPAHRAARARKDQAHACCAWSVCRCVQETALRPARE